MSVEILEGERGAVFFCNTSDWAFGPLMEDELEAQQFLDFLPDDPRSYLDCQLEEFWVQFKKQQKEE